MKGKKQRIQMRKELFRGVQRAVIKVGTGVLTAEKGLNLRVIGALARQISWLMSKDYEVILVSSGAIGSGIKKVGLKDKPARIPEKQATAAVGQPSLIQAYERAFHRHKIQVGQILLTRDDLCNRKRYLNARNTLNVLLEWGILPVINENDTVVVDELKFGDNDNLSAMITHLMDAQVLISLTDTDGLFDKDPRVHDDAALLPLVAKINRTLELAAHHSPGALGTGGMLSKIETARKVTKSGIPMIIANGLKANILKNLFQGKDLGTLFVPQPEKMTCRKCWIAFTLKEKGVIKVDRGAAKAISKQGKSLLPIGITGVEGDFRKGAMVNCVDPDGLSFAKGLVNYKAADIRKLAGLKTSEIEKCLGYKSYDEIIHRDNLVMITDEMEALTCQ
jgi:glutamate 5-kinase